MKLYLINKDMGCVFKTGEIVRFNITGRQFADDGFAMGGIFGCADDELELFKQIDIESFPSWRDFKRPTTKVKHGSYAIVLKKVGRPMSMINDCEKWGMYDVYEVFTSQFTKRHVFKFNIYKAF